MGVYRTANIRDIKRSGAVETGTGYLRARAVIGPTPFRCHDAGGVVIHDNEKGTGDEKLVVKRRQFP